MLASSLPELASPFRFNRNIFLLSNVPGWGIEGKERGIFGDMSHQESRKIVSRLHRIAGQLRGLENLIDSGESPLLVIAQFDAAIVASKSALQSYVETIIDDLSPIERQKLLKRLIRKG